MSTFFTPEEWAQERELNRLPAEDLPFRLRSPLAGTVAFKVTAEGKRQVSKALNLARGEDKKMTIADAMVTICRFYVEWHAHRGG